MPKAKEANVRISATVRRSTRDKLRFLAQQRTGAGRPTSESQLWSEAGALYVQQQIDMPGSRENTSKKITERLEAQVTEIAQLRAEIAALKTEMLAQRNFLIQFKGAMQPLLDRVKPPAGRE